jgi:RNA polymerase sigma-70 factor (ECF subfamily)
MDALMEDHDKSQILVEKAQTGDRAAFDALVERYQDRVRAFLQSQLGDYLRTRVDIEDLLQEVLLRAFRCLPRFRWSGDDAFLRWVSRIARNHVYEVARREGKVLVLPCDEGIVAEGDPPSHALRRSERFDRLKKTLGNLKPHYREVIELARIRRLPIREVAARMGRTPPATSQLLQRALQELKAQFGETDSLSLPDRSLLDEGDDS